MATVDVSKMRLVVKEPPVARSTSRIAGPLEWGVASRSFDGGSESGDQYLVEPFPNGVLVGVVDGLGHGPRAATAGKAAVAAMAGYSHEPLVSIFKRCHEALRRTRGVVMSLASFSDLDGTMTWVGVGNVKGMFLRADGGESGTRERLLLRGGVVGYNLPTIRHVSVAVAPGDTLVLATDGLRSVFTEGLALADAPQQMADQLFNEYCRGTDDAMVLVARYVRLSAVS